MAREHDIEPHHRLSIVEDTGWGARNPAKPKGPHSRYVTLANGSAYALWRTATRWEIAHMEGPNVMSDTSGHADAVDDSVQNAADRAFRSAVLAALTQDERLVLRDKAVAFLRALTDAGGTASAARGVS